MVVIAYTMLLMVLSGVLIYSGRRYWMMNKARREGNLPKGKPTMFDVRQLLMEGKKEMAIEIYCAIFNTTPAKAKKDVDELQRSLKV